MKIRSILAGTAIAALALAGGATAPTGLSLIPKAEAAAVSVSFSVFYDELAPYGDWVRYHDAYVFVPVDVDASWRPYTRGHWVHTKRYGWTWASEEPFGWATYHYGRWGYAEDIGWYWVPGKRWAPAWVSWRRSKDYIVWAPLPPSRGEADVSVSISVGDIPEFYWVAVPARRFLAPDIHVVVVKEDREIRRVIDRTEFAGAPRITNNIVINNVIDVDVVARATGKKVRTVDVRETDDPRRARASADQVTVFNGEIAADEKAKPREVHEARDVQKIKRKRGKDDAAGAEPSTTTAPAEETGQTESAPVKTEKPAQTTAEEPKPKVDDKQPAAQTGSVEKTPAQASEDADAVSKAKKKPAAKSDTADQAPVEDDQGTVTEGKKKPKRSKSVEEDTAQPSDATGSTTVPEQNAVKEDGKAEGNGKAMKEKTGRKGKDKSCDPQTEDCKPQD